MKVLVAGIGNVFMRDDGFGVEVVRRMSGVTTPEGVRVCDYGIRGVHLAYELLDGYDALVLVDAVPMGEPPGTVALIEPDVAGLAQPGALDAHSMSPATVLGALAHLGGRVGRVLVIGCEPADTGEGMGLSEEVSAAIGAAVDLCLEVLDELCPSVGSR